MRIFFDYIIRLTMVSVIAAGLLAYVYESTAAKIAANKEQDRIIKMKNLIPEADEFKEIVIDDKKVIQGYSKGIFCGTIFDISANGYGGEIKLLAGVDGSGTLMNIVILSHKETPGLGKKIEEEWFKNQFKGKTYKSLKLKKDDSAGEIDAITAATISSRAVTNAVCTAVKEYGVQP